MTREGIVAGPLLACSAAAAASGSGRAAGGRGAAGGRSTSIARRASCAPRVPFPAWSHPRVVPLILACGLAEGSGAMLLLGGADSAGLVALALATTLAREAAREAYRRGLLASAAPAQTLAWFAHPLTRALQACACRPRC